MMSVLGINHLSPTNPAPWDLQRVTQTVGQASIVYFHRILEEQDDQLRQK